MGSHKNRKKHGRDSSSDSNAGSGSESASSDESTSRNRAKKSKHSKHSSDEEMPQHKSSRDKYSKKTKGRDDWDHSEDEEQLRKKKKDHDHDRYHDDKRHRKDYHSEKSREDRYEEKSRHYDRNYRKNYDSREEYDNRNKNKRHEHSRNNRDSADDYRGYNRERREDRGWDDRRDNERDYRSRNNKNDDKFARPNDRKRRSRSRSFDHANARWGRADNERKSEKKAEDKQKPNFGLSGKLTEETNTYRGVVIKYSEPPEARKPRRRWRLYPFKGEKALQTLYIHRESAYLIGRDRKVVDLPVDHPSCSKQHAALQYRLVPFTRDDGSAGKRVRPYIIDLESANGTFINNKKIEPKKYVELLEKDVIKFGFSSREYVLLHENSKDEGLDDDVKMEELEELPIKEEKE